VLAMDIDGSNQQYLYGYKAGRVRGASGIRRGEVVVPDEGWGWIIPPRRCPMGISC
jgi:hypothetical protein